LGWGSEDDDLFNRLNKKDLNADRRYCEYLSLPHEKVIYKDAYYKNLEILEQQINEKNTDIEEGLTTLKYVILKEETKNNIHHIIVMVQPHI